MTVAPAPADAVRDALNPKFVYHSMVHFDELDPMQMLHNARFAMHVERAIAAYYLSAGGRWELRIEDNPDQFHVVRDFRIEFLSPVLGPGPMRVDVWVEHLGNTSCVYGFLCSSIDGNTAFARGERTIVKIDPLSRRPAAWTARFREKHEMLLKDLPSLA